MRRLFPRVYCKIFDCRLGGICCAIAAQSHEDGFVIATDARVLSFEPHKKSEGHSTKTCLNHDVCDGLQRKSKLIFRKSENGACSKRMQGISQSFRRFIVRHIDCFYHLRARFLNKPFLNIVILQAVHGVGAGHGCGEAGSCGQDFEHDGPFSVMCKISGAVRDCRRDFQNHQGNAAA